MQLEQEPTSQAGPLTAAAAAWTAGLLAGNALGGWWLWVTLAAAGLAMLAAGWRRGRHTWVLAGLLVAISGTAAVWLNGQQRFVAGDDVSRWVPPAGEPAQLAEVAGQVVGPVYMSTPQRGAMGRFAFMDPSTLVLMDVRGIVVGGQLQRASGRLLVVVGEAEHRLRRGDRIRGVGWLGAIDAPSNAGEYDFAALAKRQGLAGRLSLPARGSWQLEAPAATWSIPWVGQVRERIARACARSLAVGIESETDRLALLHALLLGQRQSLPREMTDAFREVGLSHILSISGAHLGVLVGMVWIVARLVLPTPARAAMVAGVVLLLYLSAVPLETPIVRSAIMAGLYAGAYSTGWRVRRLEPLAAAALVVLVWRPGDLFEAGFQLSYGVVLAMMLFTPGMVAWLTPRLVDEIDPYTPGLVVAKGVLGYVAVSVVAFVAAMPVVAYHFQVVSPWAVVLSVLAWPLITGVLVVGYVKVAAGLVLPSVGLLLAGPLAWLADAMASLVEQARHWPGAVVTLRQSPSAAWVWASAAVGAAVMGGWFAGRRVAAAVAVGLCVVWPVWASLHEPPSLAGSHAEPALQLTMFAVGDGSCFLLRSAGRTLMFDCGSQNYLDVGEKSIVPGLRQMGVGRIDVMMLSHADLDHYGGVLDVADGVAVGRVLVTGQMLGDAASKPNGPTAFLLAGLAERGVPVERVQAGWRGELGEAKLALLWPPPDYTGPRRNDDSLVLAAEVAGRRVLLNGDIAGDATTRLLDGGEARRADVTDLPHHGSFVPDVSPRWLAAVSPRVVLQSSGRDRMRTQTWQPYVEARGIDRLITDRDGMVQLEIAPDGHITWGSMHGPRGQVSRGGS